MAYLNYNKKVIKEFKSPSNMGELKNPDGHGMVGNPTCGDVMEIFLKVKGGRIADIRAKTFGCVAAIATTSVMTKLVKGKTIADAKKLTKQEIIKQFGEMPPIKIHCSVLGLEALHAAIKDYEEKKGKH
ncbi:iron-sulfur cluster assembly scaffold protein [Candidatus Woesearchaeota archaeon]|nr:iron-sulfur cluster assembly scaffold protein [Candidatus Woesearchaeota archaeon]